MKTDTTTPWAQSKHQSNIEKNFFYIIERLRDYLSDAVYRQKQNSILWCPVFFALGIGLYFSLPLEPPLILSCFLSLIIFAGYSMVKQISAKTTLFILFLICLGFSAATFRTVLISAPILEKQIQFSNVTGTITEIEPMEEGSGSRIILSDLNIEKLEPHETPQKMRLQLRQDKNIKLGDRITALAGLNPPSAAIIPDGFSFRKFMFFKQIGAVGFIFNEPEVIEKNQYGSFWVDHLRLYISEKIKQSLPAQQASIALALIVGQKNAISDADKEAMRNSGLAHMLVISGLHVGLISTTLFFVIRFLLVLIPNFALRYPVKKIAAALTLGGAVFYMLIAGATIPTQRAVLMAAIVLLAIILDRSPFSLRLVAVAALAILLIAPESLISVSFQMSFAAVTALIFIFDVTRKYWIEWQQNSGWWRKIFLYFLAVSVTTLIASLATAPFALYHFGKVSYLGSVSNFIGVPILTFIIMPFALLSLVLMPFDLSYWQLQAMGLGIDQILELAHWAASWPDAIIKIPAWEFLPFVSLVTCGVLFVVWNGKEKAALIPLILYILFWPTSHIKPDILIQDEYEIVGFKIEDNLYVSTLRAEKFTRAKWEEFYGLEEKDSQNLYKNELFSCDEQGCRVEIKDKKIALVKDPYILDQECVWADLILYLNYLPKSYDRKNRCKNAIIIEKIDTK
ncbi:MAG: DUF4131 domain-containing protein [Alphaproteobacteria bacterium]|nr:DUF4131 domain-containing protein [Alphaproteobacteria bacterium]